MPQVREHILSVDLERTFARAIRVKTTVWTLAEMRAAAGVPKEATYNHDLRIHTPGHYDEPESREMHASDFELSIVQYFDAITGQELRKVNKRQERQTTQVYFEESYEPIVCSVDPGGSGRADQPALVEAEA